MKPILTLRTARLLAPLAAVAAPERPNVLFFCTDQQQAGMLGCAGNCWLQTPAMGSLAPTGAGFERAYGVNPRPGGERMNGSVNSVEGGLVVHLDASPLVPLPVTP